MLPSRVTRGHEAIPHTADVGLRAWGASREAAFEEAALGLAELGLGRPTGGRAGLWEDVELEADDLESLAYAWLNELIALGEIHRAAVIAVDDLRFEGPGPARLVARVGLRRFGGSVDRPLRHLKAATYHGLQVRPRGSGWTLVAYVDV